jgi:hypothetical protein
MAKIMTADEIQRARVARRSAIDLILRSDGMLDISIREPSGKSQKRKKSLCFKSLRRHSQRFRDPTNR